MVNDLFSALRNITDLKNENDLGTAHYNCYMINRFLSMKPGHLHYAALLNRYWDLPKEYQEILLFHLIPQRRTYFKYFKPTVAKRDFIEQKKNIIEKYKCSERKAEEIIIFYSKIQEKKNGF